MSDSGPDPAGWAVLQSQPVPDTYLIGAPKAGTTSLAHWLGQHPNLFFSVPKEPYFWATDYPLLRAHYGFDDPKEYVALFAGAGGNPETLRIAEGSTTYLYSSTAVPLIQQTRPGARFIVALRHPTDLLVSYHRTQIVALNEREPDFSLAWERCLGNEKVGWSPLDDKLIDYPRVGALGAAIEALFKVVDREQVHFVPFRKLSQDPRAAWDEVCRFLELDPSFEPEFAVRNPSNKAIRSHLLRRLSHRPPPVLAPLMRRARHYYSKTHNKDSFVRRMIKAGIWQPSTPPVVDPALQERLSEYFAEDLGKLEALTGIPIDQLKRARS